jgi:hypothetical protein
VKLRHIFLVVLIFLIAAVAGLMRKSKLLSVIDSSPPPSPWSKHQVTSRPVMAVVPPTYEEAPVPAKSVSADWRTNELFVTAETRWTESIVEEPFARFRDWAELYVHASTQEKLALELEGVRLSRTRREAMAEMIQSNPQRALQFSVPMRVLQLMPGSVRAQLEEQVSGRGRLAVLGVLPEDGKEREVVPTIRTVTLGTREFNAFVYGRRLGEPTRDNIPIHGIAIDKLMAVNEHPLRILERAEIANAKANVPDPICAISGNPASIHNDEVAADAGGGPIFLCGHIHALELNDRLIAQESGGPGITANGLQPSSWTEGQKSIILIRVDFPDLPGQPFDSPAGTALISNVNSFYMEMSYARSGFLADGSGSDITPTLRMPQSAAWYGMNSYYNQLRTDARTAAAAAGYVLTNYDRDMICMGLVPGFNWAGLGYVGSSGAWIRGSFSTEVAAHELGHNLGLNHANFWDTSGQSAIGVGTSVEYGDVYDNMGVGRVNHFNVRNKAYLNWLKTNEWINVTSNGTYRIFAHDNPGSTGARALRITKNSNTNYWVEFRQNITGNKWLMNGAGLRWGQNGNQQSQLLDTTPGSGYGKNDSCIVIGRTFSDQTSGIHITPVGKGGTFPESLDLVVNLVPPSNQPPVLELNASATTAGPNGLISFTASAVDPDGDAMAYYWDFGDGTFGTNAAAVSKSWASAGEYIVRCIVSDMKGGVTSRFVIVTIGAPGSYRISGSVRTSAGPLEGVRVYTSATQMAYTDTNGRYTIVNLAPGDYNVNASLENYLVTNSASNPATIGPNATGIDFVAVYSTSSPPKVVTQPISQIINSGTNATFSVRVTGSTPLRYQWRFNGANISGANGSSYTKFAAQTVDAGNYSVVITNIAGIATSADAIMKVIASSSTPPTLGPLTLSGNGQPQFLVTGKPSERYLIQFSSNLLDWTDGITITNLTGTVQFMEIDPLSHFQRFYRSRLIQ